MCIHVDQCHGLTFLLFYFVSFSFFETGSLHRALELTMEIKPPTHRNLPISTSGGLRLKAYTTTLGSCGLLTYIHMNKLILSTVSVHGER